MTIDIQNIISKSLGDSTSYAVYTDKVDNTLLNPIPRKFIRDELNLNNLSSNWVGYDVWNCYEATFLTKTGVPVAGTLKFIIPANSEYMIESKSMKLYLNTFDMCKLSFSNKQDCINEYINIIKSDLNTVLNTNIEINFFDSIKYSSIELIEVLDNSINIDTIIDYENIVLDDFVKNENHLLYYSNGCDKENCFYTNILRSRCRHTKQKDTGLAVLKQNGDILVEPLSFFKEIVSLREVNEFHEFCAEKLYQNLYRNGYEFSISLLYSRRVSLDINPIRATNIDMIDKNLIDVNILTKKTQ